MAIGPPASSAQCGGRLRWWYDIRVVAEQHLRKDGPKVRTILVSFMLFLTVVSSVCLGVGSAYAAIQGVLRTFAHHPQQVEESAPALIAHEAPVQQG
jgi:hypothetical protein